MNKGKNRGGCCSNSPYHTWTLPKLQIWIFNTFYKPSQISQNLNQKYLHLKPCSSTTTHTTPKKPPETSQEAPQRPISPSPYQLPTPQKIIALRPFMALGVLKGVLQNFQYPFNIGLERRLADSSDNHKTTTTNNDKNFRNQFEWAKMVY